MGRIVEPLTNDRRLARGRPTGLGLAICLGLVARSAAGYGDEPELSPPSEMPLVSKPLAPAVTPIRPVNPPRGGRAVLALPGITTPSNRPPVPLEPVKPALEPLPGEPSLDAPIEMRPLPDSTRTRATITPRRSSPPLVLESSPIDEPEPLGGSTTRKSPSAKRPAGPPRVATPPAQAPSRRPRLFGLIPGPPTLADPPATRTTPPGRSIVDDVREDPAVDSALKRRIERQARDMVGDRARSIEVRVVGKDAVVQARGVKFLQKRGVRKSLEGLPALSGLRSSIEVLD